MMDGVLDGSASIRTNSPSSVHRQPSASFSNVNKRSMCSQSGYHTNGNPIASSNASNLNYQLKDLDKYTKYFIIKSVQVIVQSRVAGHQKVRTDCKPNGNDWFNINIQDVAEVSERTKAALDQDGLSAKSDWRVCCEISMRTSDGVRVVLEHWIISNRAISSTGQNNAQGFSRFSTNQLSSRSLAHDRSSPVHLSPSGNASSSLTSPGQASSSTGAYTRVRHATFSHTSRSRLNSIDSGSGDECLPPNKPLKNPTSNCDIKSSTSCYSLSSANNTQFIDQNVNHMTTSPSISSLSAKSSPATTQNGIERTSRSGPITSIYTIYNRMSLLLKTLMTTAHIVPAYRLSSRTSETDPCVICYRVYTSPSMRNMGSPKSNIASNLKGSIEDVNTHHDSPNRKSSSSNSSLGSLNMRDFVGPEELDSFCPIMRLGTIRTEFNELDVSLCYRTDISSSGALLKSPRSKELYKKMFNEDCIMAAKQLLAGNDRPSDAYRRQTDTATVGLSTNPLSCLDRPLRPAFAIPTENFPYDPSLEFIESAFEDLIQIAKAPHDDDQLGSCVTQRKKPNETNGTCRVSSLQSEPIQVPNRPNGLHKTGDLYPNLSTGSTPKSLLESYVFVDLNPPFASEEHSDISSFIHGPSPNFNNGFDPLKDVEDVTHQLADIEASASQFDEFVDNMCISDTEGDGRDDTDGHL